MRKCGVLMHITSLPGKYGIGTMGKEAFAFVDFLKAAGQSCWQILPLTPTGYGDSPYQSCSAFAGNPYLIDFDLLIQDGLLTQEEAAPLFGEQGRVDFGKQYQYKTRILRLAFGRFVPDSDFEAFCADNSSWLSDFALFMALKQKFAGAPWYAWEDALMRREPDAVWQARQALKEDIRFFCFAQYLFFRQWNALHSYAARQGISIIGDVPIYVPLDSVEVWSSPEFFQLDEDLKPTAVAGVPPDYFSEDGQLWGNPLYRWDVMAADGYGWWLRRLEAAGKLYDVTRLDHFRGFESYWAVPYGDENARGGRWVKGPGMDFFDTVKEKLPGLSIIAEDLGILTDEVRAMHLATGFPGMKVLGFAFDSLEPCDHLPHTYTENSVCYTATHDNMTTKQWLDTASRESLAYARSYMALNEREGFVWGVIRTALASVSRLCIVPLQDYLELGAESRMNFPGTLSDSNWTWRINDGIIDPELAGRMRRLASLYGRI